MNQRVRRSPRMLTCPNCGAAYREGLPRCPYCRSVDDYQDETDFMEDLEELRDRVEDIPEDLEREQKRRYGRETARDLHRIFRIVLIAAAVIGLLIAADVYIIPKMTGRTEEDRQQDRREMYLWKQENYPVMEDLYEKEDWEGLLAFADEAQGMGIYDWEHYNVIEGLRKIAMLTEYSIPEADTRMEQDGADSGRTLDAYAEVLRDEIALRFWENRTTDEKDVRIVKEQAAGCLDDLQARFALTQEETEALRQMLIKGYGELMISECREFLKDRGLQ